MGGWPAVEPSFRSGGKASCRTAPHVSQESHRGIKGKRYTTADHREALKINGWDFSSVEIMD